MHPFGVASFGRAIRAASSPVQKLLRRTFSCAGRRPGAPKWVPGQGLGRQAAVGVVDKVFLGFLPGTGPTAFVEQIPVVGTSLCSFRDKFQQSKIFSMALQIIDRVRTFRFHRCSSRGCCLCRDGAEN